MYKSILVPVDVGSPDQGKQSLALARKMGGKDADIIMLAVIEDVPSYVLAQMPFGMIEAAENKAALDLQEMAKTAGVKAEIVVRLGHAGSTILTLVEEKPVDLIVIASHRPGLKDYFLGSTASRVVRHAPCSVLVMR
jgi:nucleotide-binding universal stress UspA family protein